MNHVIITGRLGADIDLRQTTQGVSVATFSLAVSRPRTKDTTDWINCVAWRQSAEFLNRFTKKGDLIAVAGILTSRKYEDKQGAKRVVYEVVCDRVESLQRREGDQVGSYSPYDAKVAQQNTTAGFDEIDEDEEFPF